MPADTDSSFGRFEKKEVTKPADITSTSGSNNDVLSPESTQATKKPAKRMIKVKTEEPAAKRMKIDASTSRNGKKQWLRVGGIKLTINDRNSIIAGERLNDMVINVAQKLLKSRFSKMKGLNSTLLQGKKSLNKNHTFLWQPLDCGSICRRCKGEFEPGKSL